MKINAKGLDLIKSFEGLRLNSYQDAVGVWTIGWGSTGPDIGPGMTWTVQECEARLLKDVSKFEMGVSKMVNVPLTSNQFSALVSFSYNVGLGNLQSSTLLRLLNASKYQEAADQLPRWNKAGGKELAGLTRRRNAERDLFLTPEGSLLPDGPSDEDINIKLEEIEQEAKKLV